MLQIFLIILLSFSPLLFAEDIDTPKQESEVSKFVKVSDITAESINVSTKIKKMTKLLEENFSLEDMQNEMVPYCDSIDVMTHQKKYIQMETQNRRELQKMYGEVVVYAKQIEENIEIVKKSIDLYSENLSSLKDELELWHVTKENALKEEAPDSLQARVSSVIQELQELEEKLKINYDKLLTSSQLLATKELYLKELQEQITKVETVVTNRVFYQNQAPLLELIAHSDFSVFQYISSNKNAFIDKYIRSKDYLLANEEQWLIYFSGLFLTFMFVVYYNYLYRKRKLFVRDASLNHNTFFFIGRPVSTLLVLSVLLVTFSFSDRPKELMEILLVLIIFPVIRILQTVIDKKYYKYIYAPLILYILLVIERTFSGFELESRVFILLMNLGLLVYVIELIRKNILLSYYQSFIMRYGNYFLYLVLGLLVIAIGANFYGTMLLSTRIVSGVINTLSSALIFYMIYVILTGYIVVILRRRISSASYMLDKYSKNIEKTTALLIKTWMLLWWLLLVSKMVSLYPYMTRFWEYFLSLSWEVANTTLSVESVLNFLFIIVGTWVLVKLVKTILEVEIFARFKLPRGAPTAITTTLNYVIIITGTIIAFSSLGVSPQQFALLFGALGVGIGFGLRNIIANFVSGVIMVFERPIQIGDTIEVDKTTGSVQSIGVRSSTVKTFDGSEVIIPNADFIAKEIVNWTLSDEHRRKTVEFKVDLESDVQAILSLMNEAALAHPDVLKDPKPIATLKSFGDYYLEFKLYFWLSDNLIVAQSDVHIAIYKALKDAGIKMPVPKTNFEKSNSSQSSSSTFEE